MKKLKFKEYVDFASKSKCVTIGDTQIEVGGEKEVKILQPPNFIPESSTVWSFPERGTWATHYLNAKYRGNWAPQVPRNLILKYSKEGETVLDQMVGSGTTLIECKLLGRNSIGVDVNPDALMIAADRLDFNALELPTCTQELYVGDARKLNLVKDDSVDLVLTQPPYAGIIAYSNHRLDGDLSGIKGLKEFTQQMRVVASESFRVLKPGKHCAILIGDTRKRQHFISISTRIMHAFVEAGFILREEIIKVQHNTKMGRERWTAPTYNFYKIAHEHLYVFRKPEKEEKLTEFEASTRFW